MSFIIQTGAQLGRCKQTLKIESDDHNKKMMTTRIPVATIRKFTRIRRTALIVALKMKLSDVVMKRSNDAKTITCL
jgi:hypothetical protein